MTTALKREPRRSLGPRRAHTPADGRRLPVRAPNAFRAVGAPKRREDLLLKLSRAGEIDEVGFQLGRHFQQVWERESRVGGVSWSGLPGGNVELRKAAAWRHTFATGEQVRAMEKRMERVIGDAGVKVVKSFLTGQTNFSTFGETLGRKSPQRAPKDASAIFLWQFKQLVEEWCSATGPSSGCYRAS